jgi:aryl-alcohol dehydrogenase-like predicted oxidoreductase
MSTAEPIGRYVLEIPRRVWLVRPGWRPPGEDRPSDEAVQRHGRVADDGKLSALNIRRALDASLTRLQTDYIDLYQFHHVDRATPWDEIWQATDVAITAGKILHVGSSNFAGRPIAEA